MPVALNVTAEDAAGAVKLRRVCWTVNGPHPRGLVEGSGLDPPRPAWRVTGKAGVASGLARKRTTLERRSTNDVERTLNPTNQPTNQPNPARPRARAKGQMTPLRDLLPPPPGYEDHES
jgi:hypothetical protein